MRKQQTIIPYTPEQNGTVERENKTIVEAARTQLRAKSLDKRLWAEAVNASVFVLNCAGTSTVKDRIRRKGNEVCVSWLL